MGLTIGYGRASAFQCSNIYGGCPSSGLWAGQRPGEVWRGVPPLQKKHFSAFYLPILAPGPLDEAKKEQVRG